MEVSVLVPVLDEARHLSAVLASLCEQRHPGEMEFLLIDGGSRDGSRELIEAAAQRDRRIRLIENPGRTTPRALNRGLAAARGEFVVRMDAHARYPRDYVTRAVERLRRGDVVSVSGPQLAVGYDRVSRRVALALESPLGAGGASFRRSLTEEIEVDSGFTGAWRRSVLLEHGGWEDDWVGDEDYELAARLRRAGGRIVCLPELAAAYAPRGSLASLGRQYWRYGRARARTTRRHPQSLRPSQLAPGALVLAGALAPAGPRALTRPARAAWLLYAGALLSGGARAVSRGATASDAAALPAIWATMHLAYGAGLLAGAARHGVSTSALAHVAHVLARRASPSGSQRRGGH